MYRLYTNTVQLYIRDLGICRFWNWWASQGYQGTNSTESNILVTSESGTDLTICDTFSNVEELCREEEKKIHPCTLTISDFLHIRFPTYQIYCGFICI
jgi:hypothetical protein